LIAHGFTRAETHEARAENPWGGERVDGATLELESFLTARINRLARVLNKPTDRACVVEFGIAMLEWRVLAHLSQASPCLARDLAARMAIGKASISRVLRRLHERKLIAIRASSDDARASILTVLPAGPRMYESMLPSERERQAALLNALNANEREALSEVFGKLMSAAEEITHREGPAQGRSKQ
jgi:DNA-binding MarR family transcriptional regulator